jgi:hypothetical protein
MKPLGLAVAAALVRWGGAARAQVGESLGFGPRDMAVGLSAAARPVGPAAAFHNPAALADGAYSFGPGASRAHADDTLVELAFVYAHALLHAARDTGGAVPLAAAVPDTIAATAGVRVDLGALRGRPGIDFGLLAYVPGGDIFRWSIHPDERAQWLFATDRTQHLGVHLALGWRIARWLSIGAAVRVLFDVQTFTTARVTSVTSETVAGASKVRVSTQLGEDVTVFGRVAPTVGILATPIDALRLGLTWRGKLYVDDWGWTRIQGVPATGDLGYVHRFAHYFEPHTLVAAAAGRIGPVWLSADVAYARWSEALTANHQALGPGRFGDTITPSVGLSVAAGSRLELRAGYRFVRSPFDNFGGPTNLLDADQHVASLGGEARLGTVRAAGVTFRLAWAVRTAFLRERHEEKDPRRFASDRAFLANEGRAAYRYGGAIPGASLSVEARW